LGITDCFTRLGRPVVEFDKAAEAKLRLKIDLYIVPTAFMLYLFCFIDRTNIGKLIDATVGPWLMDLEAMQGS
jgi:hypothetical protein